jgi:AcrR family transcriptional regulator
MSKGLLYHYYDSKEELIFAIIRTHLLELDEAVSAADIAGLAPRARLQALIGAVLANYRGADNKHKVQLNAASALSEEQKAEIQEIERRIVRRFSAALRQINPALAENSRHLLMPVTMSLFGMLNWVYLWFRDGGPITRDDYTQLATTLIVEGVGALK